MPFASCNPTNPRTNLWNFHEKILRIGDFEKWPFLKNGHFGFFFQKKKNFFCFILMKISPNLHGRMDGLKFWCFLWFPENSLLCVKLRYTVYITAKRKLERLQFSTSSSFFKIWSACSCEFKAYFWTFWALYHLLFDLETIGVN